MTTYYSTSMGRSLSKSPYGALMYARATNKPDACIHDIIDVESDDLHFEDRPNTTHKVDPYIEIVDIGKGISIEVIRDTTSNPRYWNYKHKKLLDKLGCYC